MDESNPLDRPMTPKEAYDFKRKCFIEKTIKYFNFLVTDFGYKEPFHKISQQENGTEILDEFIYENRNVDRLVTVSNAYHPVDYGFEICFYKPSISTAYGKREMVYYLLKDDQDIEQSYLEQAARTLKDDFDIYLKGYKWFVKEKNSI